MFATRFLRDEVCRYLRNTKKTGVSRMVMHIQFEELKYCHFELVWSWIMNMFSILLLILLFVGRLIPNFVLELLCSVILIG